MDPARRSREALQRYKDALADAHEHEETTLRDLHVHVETPPPKSDLAALSPRWRLVIAVVGALGGGSILTELVRRLLAR